MSNRLMFHMAAAGATIAVVIAGATAADAQPARATVVKPFANNLIVTQKSMGGFTIGESPASARKHFPKKDCTAYACLYKGSGYNVQVNFGSKPNTKKVDVDYISIIRTTGKNTATKLRTSAGVGLGSTYAKTKKGLGHAKSSGNSQAGYFYIGKGTLGSVDTYVYVTRGYVSLFSIQRVDRVG